MVYGDIGTSPLYALKECFAPEYGIAPTPANVLGILSLIFWSLNFVVSFKYLVFIMRAHNRGEGGIMALLALLHPRQDRTGSRRWLVSLGLFGAALLYGDGVITPAISVLGAVEGIGVATPALNPITPVIAAIILFGLFLFQKRGTARIGAVFGRVMLVWFGTIAALGVAGIVQHPEVLRALNPLHALDFMFRNGRQGLLVLGAVILVVTGAEALYADMGHFGKRPIRLAWFSRGVAGAGAQLLRPGGRSVGSAGHRAESFLWPGPVLGVVSHGAHCHHRGGCGLPSADFRSFLPDPAGGTAGIQPAGDDPTHLTDRDRPDLPPRAQSNPGAALRAPRAGIPELRRSGLGLRHRRYRYDDDHHAAVLRRGPPAMELECGPGRHARGGVPGGGPVFPGGKPGEDREGWLVPAPGGRRGLSVDDHLEAGA